MESPTDELAEQVERALAAEDVSSFADLLDSNVTWGAPSSHHPTCQNRQQVLRWYQRAQWYQVLSVHDGRIVDIVGFDDVAEARSYIPGVGVDG